MDRFKKIFSHFSVPAEIINVEQCTYGHINSTYFVDCDNGKQYVLQKINTKIFKDPFQLTENIVNIGKFLKAKTDAVGGNSEREVMQLIPANDGSYLVRDGEDYWRLIVYITDAISFQEVTESRLFYNAAVAFGKFQRLLSDFPADTLHETIPDFHNTVDRLRLFREALAADSFSRAESVRDEIDFILSRADKCSYITDRIASGEYPLRVTHNDTKLNNIMIDKDTLEGVCVIDLDTVMPGSVLYDFGDAIRFGASSAAEDEKDLSKVYLKLDLFELYAEGFIKGLDNSLTEAELRGLPMGAYVITLETGIRFLTDYLNGDVYFKTHYDGQNLVRARTQLKLISDMEDKMNIMNGIIEKFL